MISVENRKIFPRHLFCALADGVALGTQGLKKLEWWGYQVVKRVLKIGLFSRLDTITACGRLCRLSSGLKIMICLSNFPCTRSLLLALCALYIVIFLWYNRRQHKIQRQKKGKTVFSCIAQWKIGPAMSYWSMSYVCMYFHSPTGPGAVLWSGSRMSGWPLFSGGVDLSI